MKKKMYKEARQLSDSDTMSILRKGTNGVLSLNGEDGFPYAVPVNYVILDDKVYLHSAKYGYKNECIARDSRCCFAVTVIQKLMPAKVSCAYESVIMTGHISIVDDDAEKRRAMDAFINDLCAGSEELGFKFLEKSYPKIEVLRIDPDETTGKGHLRKDLHPDI